MVLDSLQLAIFAGLGALCAAGYGIERARTKAWQVDTSGRIPPSVRRFHVVGEGEWITLGISEEGAAGITVSPILVASGFDLRDDAGNLVSIAAGSPVEIRAFDGARRVQVDGSTSEEGVSRRYTFEVRPEAPLFTRATGVRSALTPYRREATKRAAKSTLVLAGKPEAVAGVFFAGCWLIVLVAFVGGGLIASLAGATKIAWVVLGVSLVFIAIGAMVLPRKLPDTPALE